MERKIGEIFDYKGKKLCVKIDDHPITCGMCYFKDKDCLLVVKDVGNCESIFRRDHENVSFVEVIDNE